MLFSIRNTPRWIIFGIDLSICTFSILLAYLLRFNFSIPESEILALRYVVPFLLLVRTITFFIFKTYAGIVRYTSTKDAQRILTAIFFGSLFFAFFNPVQYHYRSVFLIPYSIIIIDFMTTVFTMTALRLLVKTLYLEYKIPARSKTNVIIFGAGESAIITKRTLDRDAGTKYKVLAFVDDNPKTAGKKMEGVTIYHSRDLENLLSDNSVAHLIISIQNILPERRKEIVETCLNYNTKILHVPPYKSWINGELSFKQIKKVKIEDLLEREPIQLDMDRISRQLKGKKILITGAAGSIGSEIVRQVMKFEPGLVIMLDCAESPLHELDLEMGEKFKYRKIETVIGDVRNPDRMRNIFSTFRPEIVYHAAAYKHVPMMENNPSESILTNVNGTRITATLSVEYNVNTFVFVSTDKAVNPSNIMGASKRISEMFCQSLGKLSATKFITTRFGNVLGSNGSVIPRFRKQIETGGPVTITHPEITRYFMTIPEACQLVLEAGAMGNGGEVFIFDMGKSVKVLDLAKKMIKLSGLTLGKDIQIVFSGLRPGEKLYEELLNDQENTVPTHNKKIMIAKVKEFDHHLVNKDVEELVAMFPKQNNDHIVRKVKQIVSEYKSNNSVFEQIDAELEKEFLRGV